MIKTNSELPITMLREYNETLNDFDFVLFHLYVTDPEYKRYFDDMRKTHPERQMILDNSAYELYVKGETLNFDKYKQAIIELKPDYYLLPDVLMDSNQTMINALTFKMAYQGDIEKYFENRYNLQSPQPIAVVQGNSIKEFNSCMLFMINCGYSNIAIPFHNSFFRDMEYDEDIAYELASAGYNVCTEDVRYAMGRVVWFKEFGIKQLVVNGKPLYKKLHFLGSHCPAEKKCYESLSLPGDVSMDTGYPVKCAIEGIELGKEKSKPNIIIDNFMNDELSDDTKELIIKNVTKFKEYNKTYKDL